MSTLAITRRPGADLGGGELTFLEREPVDLERALAQHEAYVETLRSIGLDVRVLDPLPGHPDACFVEDPALVLDDVAVLARPGVESRLAEVESLESVLGEYRALERIDAPCTLEGGDALVIDGVVYVGQSTRTNHAGLKALAHALLPHGYRVKAAEVKGCLHLKTACTFLGRDTLLVNPEWVDLERFPPLERIPVDPREPFAANVLRIGESLVLSAAFPRTRDRVAARGFDVRTVDLSEFHKLEAGPTCLSLVIA